MPTVKRLLTAHPYLFHLDDSGWPVPHRCISDPVNVPLLDLDLAKLFVAHGADLNRKTDSGLSLLFLAATNSRTKDIADYFVTCGAQMSSFEESVATIMKEKDNRAAKAKIEKILQKEPELIHYRGHAGFSLLHHAVRHHRLELAGLLLDLGSDPNVLTTEGESPLGLARGLADEDIASRGLLKKKGAKLTLREVIADLLYEEKDDEALKCFEANPPLIHTWYQQQSMLHIAVLSAKSARIVSYILDHGVSPNTPNTEGETPLHLVMRRGSLSENADETVAMFRALIEHGAQIEPRDARGWSPLHAAVAFNQEQVAKMLVELGADVNGTTKDGETPLDFVYEQKNLGYEKLARWLKTRGARSDKRKS
jgi:ankyrin repeat protein